MIEGRASVKHGSAISDEGWSKAGELPGPIPVTGSSVGRDDPSRQLVSCHPESLTA